MSKVACTQARSLNGPELWYQPKISSRSLLMHGVEALLRANRAPRESHSCDSHVAELIVEQAIDGWRQLCSERRQIEIAINLSMAFFRTRGGIGHLCQRLPPDDASFQGLLIEIDGSEVVDNLRFARSIANRLRFSKVAISIDHVGAEWPSLSGLRDFPFVEIKVDRNLVSGCADNHSKRSTCDRILKLADDYGARTVAEGVETWADFLTVRELGFDLVQGSLFAEPMKLKKLKQACWSGQGHAYDPRHYRRNLDLPPNLYELADKESSR